MDTSQVEQDLNRRVNDIHTWLDGNDTTITDIRFRNRNWTAKAVELLDDPSRVERYGVKFNFSVSDPGIDLTIQLVVRIKAEDSTGPNGDSPPYVVVYVINQSTGKAEEVAHHDFIIASHYEDLRDLSLSDWLLKWLRFGLASNERKIMGMEMRINA